MNEQEITCPFCGEKIIVLIDSSQDTQDYIEDCQVCCRPIRFDVISADGELVSIRVFRD